LAMPHGHHHHQHHGHHGGGWHNRHHGWNHGPRPHFGPGPVAGALAVGALAGAVVGSVVARPQPRYYDRYDGQCGHVHGPPQPMGVVVVGPPSQQIAQLIAPQPQFIPPLGIASVRLLPSGIEHINGTTWFLLEVQPDNGGAPWRILRRYNQFYDLNNQLGSQAHHMPSATFPRKHLTGCEGAKLEQRRIALERWLTTAIQYSNSFAAWRALLRAFLEAPLPSIVPPPQQAYPVSRAMPVPLATAPQPAAALPMASSAPAASQPPLPPPSEAPPVDSLSTSGSQGMVMEIEIPPGVSAGQLLGVTVPSGEQLLVTVPERAVSGQALQLWYDPVAQSLQPLT